MLFQNEFIQMFNPRETHVEKRLQKINCFFFKKARILKFLNTALPIFKKKKRKKIPELTRLKEKKNTKEKHDGNGRRKNKK